MLITKIIQKPFLLLSIGLVIGIIIGNKMATSNNIKATETVLKETGVSKKVNESSVTNEIQFSKNKFKKTDTININIGQKPINIITLDSCKQLANKLNKLTKVQKKRLDRWLNE